jgi:hypothetical protein
MNKVWPGGADSQWGAVSTSSMDVESVDRAGR